MYTQRDIKLLGDAFRELLALSEEERRLYLKATGWDLDNLSVTFDMAYLRAAMPSELGGELQISTQTWRISVEDAMWHRSIELLVEELTAKKLLQIG